MTRKYVKKDANTQKLVSAGMSDIISPIIGISSSSGLILSTLGSGNYLTITLHCIGWIGLSLSFIYFVLGLCKVLTQGSFSNA